MTEGGVAGFPVIDLFAGAGGVSVAARHAGCDVRLGVDSDSVACRTLARNADVHHGGAVLEADVCTLDGATLRDAAHLAPSDPLVIVGGPPCQPFSKAAFWSEDGDEAAYRRARSRGEHLERPGAQSARPDARRTLVGEFLRLIVEADADGFVFENVLSLAAPRNRPILDALIDGAKRAGYRTRFLRANAADYGAPQRRERVFVLASKTATPNAPEPTHSMSRQEQIGRLPAVSAGEAIGRFAGPEFHEPEEVVSGRWAEHLKTVPPGWNYKAHTAWGGHPNPTFVTETRYWNFLLKLHPDLPSWTIPASPGPWTGPFHWESRRLRTPELAALQGFPDGYEFEGSRRERVRQIGNAAPTQLVAPMIGSVVAAISRKSAEVGREVRACVA